MVLSKNETNPSRQAPIAAPASPCRRRTNIAAPLNEGPNFPLNTLPKGDANTWHSFCMIRPEFAQLERTASKDRRTVTIEPKTVAQESR